MYDSTKYETWACCIIKFLVCIPLSSLSFKEHTKDMYHTEQFSFILQALWSKVKQHINLRPTLRAYVSHRLVNVKTGINRIRQKLIFLNDEIRDWPIIIEGKINHIYQKAMASVFTLLVWLENRIWNIEFFDSILQYRVPTSSHQL